MENNKAYGISISATMVEIGMASDLRQLLGAKNDSEVWRIAIRKLYQETTANMPRVEVIGTIEEVELNA